MRASSFSVYHGQLVPGLLLILSLTGLDRLCAQPTIVSVNPTNGATGVPTSSQVVFTFSTTMSTTYTYALFTNSTGSFLPITSAWSAGNTVLTCTPAPSFPPGTNVYWAVFGYDPLFNPLTGTTSGSFTTGGGGTGGNGTNAYTSFVLIKYYLYSQTSAAAPIPSTNAPYLLGATTVLASNRSATSITVTLPTAGVSNLTDNVSAPANWNFISFDTNQTRFETTFPQGSYSFYVQAAASNQTLAVSLPLDMPQPNAPHVTNYTAAQAINPTAAFTLGWDPFIGGAGASNLVLLLITSSGTNVFATGTPGMSNALAGTAVTATIPANTLPPGGTFSATLYFYHTFQVTNNPVNASSTFRVSGTQFTVATTGGTSGPLRFINPRVSNGTLLVDVTCSLGQTFTILSSSDPTLPIAQWTPLLTTNNTSVTNVHFVDPRPATGRAMFYQARNGT